MGDNKYDVVNNVVVSSGICGIVFGIIHTLIYPYYFSSSNDNVKYYVVICALLLGVFILSMFIVDKYGTRINTKALSWGVLVEFVFWFVCMYLNESTLYYFKIEGSLRHRINPLFYIASVILLSLGMLFLIVKITKIKKIIYYIIMMVMVAFQGAVLYAPNFVYDHNGTMFHIHAYTNSIMNAINNIPYGIYNKCIYGHYGVIYAWIAKLFCIVGVDEITTVLVSVAFTGAILFFLLYILNRKIINNDLIALLGIFALAAISVEYLFSGQYYQLLPHRVLVPVISLFAFWEYLNRNKLKILVFVVMGFGFVWNFETGIVCALVNILGVSIVDYYNSRYNLKKYYLFFLNIIYGMVSMGCAYVVLNLINIKWGGEWLDLNAFAFPVLGGWYDIEELSIQLPSCMALYFVEILFFIACVGCCLIALLKEKLDKKCIFTGIVSFMGLGLFVYYINRSAFGNVGIAHICFVITILMIMDRIVLKLQEGNDFAIFFPIAYMNVLFVVFFLLSTIGNAPFQIANRVESNWDKDNYNLLIDLIRDNVPKDTLAIEAGLPEIYSTLGWKTGINVTDWSDVNNDPECVEYIKTVIDTKDGVLCGKFTKDLVLDDSRWLCVYNLADIYFYMVRLDEEKNKEEAILEYAEMNSMSREEFIMFTYLNYMYNYPSYEEYCSIEELFKNGISDDEYIKICKEAKSEFGK